MAMTNTSMVRRSGFIVALVCPFAIATAALADEPDSAKQTWRFAGNDLHNTRSAPAEHKLGPRSVANLVPRWVFTTHGNVSATPSVEGDALYVPDWGGFLSRVNAHTGREVWAHQISEYDGTPGAISRVTPAIARGKLIIADQTGANVMAIDAETGALIWKTQADAHPAALITQSPVVHEGRVYVGVSSGEEGFAADPNYPCCSFRGSVLALDLETGAILWKTYTVPAGYAGGAVWGSTPAVDLKRHALYVTTGNNYSVPPPVAACISAAGSDLVAASTCLAADDYMDAIVALDLHTGAIKWGHRLQAVDIWTVACVFLTCPAGISPDYDFGAGPNLIAAQSGRHKRELIGAGQKSGVYWALDPDTGKIVWATVVGPGSTFGGVEWGTATDGRRIYVAISNLFRQNYTLEPSGQTITWGAFSALDAATGQILWQTADPMGSFPLGAVTVANGVLYAESIAASGPLYAFAAETGRLLWSFQSTGSAVAGPAVVNGTVYWGTGYPTGRFGRPEFVTGTNQLYAFGLSYP